MTLDPFTILGLASNILQFLDFTGKLVAGTWAISKSASGVSEDTKYLRNKTTAVSRLIDDFFALNRCSAELQSVLEGCKMVADDLLRMLEKLEIKGSKTKWKSFQIAWKETWSRHKVSLLFEKLADLQTQINTQVQLQMK
jgi:hypothetical protein